MARMMRLVAVLALIVVSFGGVRAAALAEAEKATAWTKTQQQADGSFNGFGLGSTADAMYALAAANVKVDDVATGGKNPQAFIEANIGDIAKSPGLAAKYVIAELLTGHSPRNVAGVNLVDVVIKSYNAETGVYGADVTTHALATLALVAAGEPSPAKAIDALGKYQLDDGSWSFTGDRTPKGGDTNTTSLAIQAFVAAQMRSHPAVDKGISYLQSQQNADGGFPYSKDSGFGSATDANSTALVIQAIVATDGSPVMGPWANVDGNPLAALVKLQNPSGAFRYDAATPDDNTLATYQAIPALLLKPFPLEAIVIAQPAPQPTAAPTSSVPAPSTPAPTQPGIPVGLPNTGAPINPILPVIVVVAFGMVLIGIRFRNVSDQ